MSRIAICLLTYNRPLYAKMTLESALKNIKVAGGVNLHIADDGTENHDEYIAPLVEIGRQSCKVMDISSSNSYRGGYGKSYNLATQHLHWNNDYILMLEDDWELVKELDLDRLVEAMEENSEIGCIRLGYLGTTQELKGSLIRGGRLGWWLLDPSSPEPHVFAGHPRFERVDWEKRVGPWPEGLLPGETEFRVAHNPEARKNVVWPIDLVASWGDMFAHIGAVRSY